MLSRGGKVGTNNARIAFKNLVFLDGLVGLEGLEGLLGRSVESMVVVIVMRLGRKHVVDVAYYAASKRVGKCFSDRVSTCFYVFSQYSQAPELPVILY